MIVILGAGGHARVIGALLARSSPEGFIYCDKGDRIPDQGPIHIGVGNKPGIGNSGLKTRADLYHEHVSRISSVIAETAIWNSLTITRGLQIMHRVVVQPECLFGVNVLLNTGCIIEHDCKVFSHSHIAPGAILCGGVEVGEYTHVGAGSVVKQGVRIGDRCVVQMGSVVVKDLPDGSTILANGKIIPAR